MTAASTDDTIPDTAASTVEFVSATNYAGGSELQPASVNVDAGAYRNWVRTLESAGFDYTLNGYSAGSADSFIVATTTGQLTQRLKPIVALRPNTVFPLVVLPLVRAELEHRRATGRPGRLQREHLGYGDPDFLAAHDAAAQAGVAA